MALRRIAISRFRRLDDARDTTDRSEGLGSQADISGSHPDVANVPGVDDASLKSSIQLQHRSTLVVIMRAERATLMSDPHCQDQFHRL